MYSTHQHHPTLASLDGSLASCLAEVTNTPWTERVVFPFEPTGDTVPKPLHVSPFIDMYRNWRVSSSDPLASNSTTDESGSGSNGDGDGNGNGNSNSSGADGDWVRVVHPNEVDSGSAELAPTLDVTVLTLPKSPLGKVFTAAMRLQSRRVTYEPWGWSLQVCARSKRERPAPGRKLMHAPPPPPPPLPRPHSSPPQPPPPPPPPPPLARLPHPHLGSVLPHAAADRTAHLLAGGQALGAWRPLLPPPA